MKGIVIYYSVYGSTKQYANWIAQELGCEAVARNKVSVEMLEAADYIIIGSFVLVFKLASSKWIAEKEAILRKKKLYFYSVSGALPGDPELDNVFKRSMNSTLLDAAETYQFGGKRINKELSGFHRTVLWMVNKFQKDKKKKEEMSRDINNIDIQYIKPLIDPISSIFLHIKYNRIRKILYLKFFYAII